MELDDIKKDYNTFDAIEKLKESITQDILDINAIYKKNNYSLFLVGGCVRDALMGQIPHDVDLATNASSEQTIEMLKGYRTNLQGVSFGVVIVMTKENPSGLEIASFRSDLPGRKPEVKIGGTIETDSQRRDLTINGLYYDIDKEEIIDHVGGVEDLRNGTIRTIGNPRDRFDEDRLRILRVLRFSARYNGTLDAATEQAIVQDPALHEVSPERIYDEVVKSLKTVKSVKQYFWELNRLTVLQIMFPNMELDVDAVPESRDINVILATLLHANDTKMLLKKLVADLKYPVQTAESVAYLIDMLKQPDDIFTFYKRRSKTNLTNAEIKEFADDMPTYNDFKNYVRAFLKYTPQTSGQKMMDEEGFKPGPAFGIEQRKREADYFKSLLKT